MMKPSLPSPSMVVACIALVFAVAGTAMAAQRDPVAQSSAKIDAKLLRQLRLERGWITARNLAPNSVTETQIATGAVNPNDLSPTVKETITAACRVPPQYKGSTNTADVFNKASNGATPGLVCTGTQSKAVATQATDAAIAYFDPNKNSLVGPQGQQGATGADAGFGASNRITVPSSVIASQVFAPLTGVATATPSFAAAQTATPSVPTKIENVSVKLVRASASNPPVQVGVALVINNGTPSGAGGSCTFNPQVATGCSFAGPIDVPANATASWAIATNGQIGPPPLLWGDFDLSLGFTSVQR